ncbi:hypothetical protein FHX42_000764 [Saccharopolyspora lacisalsi]|uniref:Uncharacterized protein n=1 Tax=Halosaccharopolyspora lacisalsi TaxID=1000566 RepID=A0A839DVV5_9PSEU|nr:hypothetical protein [Halosaccharopolyspora lacisalsi]MBA8823435.1 hypothetical protein [Halosaccharopolyspora lacisalsi]
MREFDQRSRDGESGATAGSEAATPPSGVPSRGGTPYFAGDLQDTSGGADALDDETPPNGIAGLPVGAVTESVVSEQDYGRAAPTVFGGPEAVDLESEGSTARDDTDEWPKLEYRSRNAPKRSGALGWIRRDDR